MKRSFFLLLSLLLCTCVSAQEFTRVVYLGRDHIQVVTKSATYLYDPIAGGFSSITDPDGNDWVSYRDKPWGEYPASAASSYRGVPNLVFGGNDDGAGHPGHTKCSSRIVDNQIKTQTISGDWGWEWTFNQTSAKLSVTLTPANEAYWFLYEGTPGGRYQPKSTFWATGLSEPSYEIPDHYLGGTHRGHHQLMYFGENDNKYVFGMIQADADTHRDHISYLGNEEIGAENSPDGMVVAGFGRDEGAKPLLSGKHTFYVALLPKKKPNKVRKRLRKLVRK